MNLKKLNPILMLSHQYFQLNFQTIQRKARKRTHMSNKAIIMTIQVRPAWIHTQQWTIWIHIIHIYSVHTTQKLHKISKFVARC